MVRITLAILLLAAAGSSEKNAPEAERDFGFLPQKCTVSHAFYLVNAGETPLAVTRIKSGCSCTSVTELKDPVPPGDSATIVVTFNSGRYLHLVRKTTEVYTDRESDQPRKFRITANVMKDDEPTGTVAVMPRKLKRRPTVATGTRPVDTLSLTNQGEAALTVSVAHSPQDLLDSLVVSDRLDPGAQLDARLYWSSDSARADGQHLSLAFTGADTLVITVPIEVED